MNKKIILGIMIVGIIFGSVGVYAGSNFYANGISVNAPTGSNLGSDATLQDSLDELYSIADKYDELKSEINSMLDKMYPVGSIYISTDIKSASDVAKKFGGTWEAYGTGKTLVGVDTSNTNFNTVSKTGGSSTTSLTTSNLPSHNHSISHTHTTPQTNTLTQSTNHTHSWTENVAGYYISGAGVAQSGMSAVVPTMTGGTAVRTTSGVSANHYHTLPSMTTNSQNTTKSGSTGSGTSFSVQNPYITVYMYKRIS